MPNAHSLECFVGSALLYEGSQNELSLAFGLVASGALALLFGFDLANVQWGYPEQKLASGWLLLFLYVSFAWVVWPMFPRYSRIFRTALRLLAALFALAGWYIPAMFAMYYFHLSIGGN